MSTCIVLQLVLFLLRRRRGLPPTPTATAAAACAAAAATATTMLASATTEVPTAATVVHALILRGSVRRKVSPKAKRKVCKQSHETV